MTLQSSGQISFADLQTEFGGSHPITMQEYNAYTGIGAGAEVGLDDFYGLAFGPQHPSRLSTTTTNTTYCSVSNGATTVTGTDDGVGSYTSLSINVTAGDSVIVAIYGYAADGDDQYDQAGFYGRNTHSTSVSITSSANLNTTNIGGVTQVTTYIQSSNDYEKIWDYGDLEQYDWFQTSIEFTVTSGMISATQPSLKFLSAGAFLRFGYFDISFT